MTDQPPTIITLEFYACQENWLTPSKDFAAQYDPYPSAIKSDGGEIARITLANLRADQSPTPEPTEADVTVAKNLDMILTASNFNRSVARRTITKCLAEARREGAEAEREALNEILELARADMVKRQNSIADDLSEHDQPVLAVANGAYMDAIKSIILKFRERGQS